jgi:pimeloyl-ACP methyl ester carboxylesterase
VDERIRRLVIDNVTGIATMGAMWLDSPLAHGWLSSINVPTVAVVGDRDHDDFVRMAELLASEIHAGRLAILPGVDHNVPVRAEQPFTQRLANFLNSTVRNGAPRLTTG